MLNGKRLTLVGLTLCLSACGGMADSLGLGRNAPDEFAVVERPPLSLPPDFSLRPPRPGAPRPQETSMSNKASETVFGGNTQQSFLAGSGSAADKSDTEKALLESAGAAKADAGIREVVDRETSERIVGSKHLLDELLWWRDPASMTVDAQAEAKRIQEAKEKGESINTGATPTIEKGSAGWLGM